MQLASGAPSWLASLLLHLAALLALALWSLPLVNRQPTSLSVSTQELPTPEFAELVDVPLDVDLTEAPDAETVDLTADAEFASLDVDALASADLEPEPAAADLLDFSASVGDVEALSGAIGLTAAGLEGRSSAARSRMVLKGGGSAESEKAVAEALSWLARHQLPDGSWNFDHRGGQCQGQCSDPGDLIKSPAGATGLALLPFLGAGNTHREGKYRDVVRRGAYALTNLLKQTPEGITVVDEDRYQMYCHGIATMALCEAFAMTGDEALRPPAQAMIDYTCYAQDPEGGGWRYKPRQPGDTSMHGWHVGALKSGFMASLFVPPAVVDRASYYLDTASVDGGEGYFYFVSKPTYSPAPSAIGHLCRMYMGASRDDKPLARGIERLVKRGPNRDKNGAYFNYYAAQAIFQFTGGEGPLWEAWNEPMRDFLIETQETDGHQRGSWTPAEGDGHARHGGRLYQTAMSCMTLEVYYRLMPIYQSRATDSGFHETDE